jgi:hypothetical protein
MPDAAERAEMRAGLRGALLLARGRVEGIALMPITATGAKRSFWAAVLCLPVFLLLRLVFSDAPITGRGLVAELCGFVAGWAGYGLATLPMAMAAGRGPLWPRFLATWNWTSLVQYGVILLLGLLTAVGLPGWLGQGLELAGLGYALWLQWFATGLALQVSGGRAAGFVLMDLVLGMVLSGFVADLSR